MLFHISTIFLYILQLTESSKIVPYERNGQNAISGQFPAMVALNIRKRLTTAFCGGTLIDLSNVVTSGHCLEGVENISDDGHSQILVIGDEIEITEPSPKRQVRSAVFHMVHPNYFKGENKLFNDIAVIRVTITIYYSIHTF